MPGQGKSDPFTIFYRPGFWPEGKTWRIRSEEIRGNNCIIGYNQHVPIQQARNNKKRGKILCKKTYKRDQEDHKPLTGTHPL